jgi:hypothetical protein
VLAEIDCSTADHDLCRAVVGVCVRVVIGFLRAHARRNGVANGRSGAV